jgi:hypothetical protein
MVFLNYTTLQMTAKIVYYGPGLCGKTTNLQWIHGRTAPRCRGEMVSLETETDRTLFFDLLPLDVGVIGGMKIRLQLYTVPGQVFYNATRRLVLKGADGVVFVADSQVPALGANEESLTNLRQNLEELGMDPAAVPVVFQYNKRDLRNILPVRKLEDALNEARLPSFEAAAIHGVGVFETLKGVTRVALDSVRTRIAEDTSRPAQARGDHPPSSEEAPPAPQVQPEPVEGSNLPTDPALMEPLAVEFAEEDTDKLKVRPVSTKGSLDIGQELRKLRNMTADDQPKPPTAIHDRSGTSGRPPSGTDARQEIHRKTALEVPPHLLKGLTDLRIHLGFDRDGREEILRDAVRLTLVGTRRLEKLGVRLDLDLSTKE